MRVRVRVRVGVRVRVRVGKPGPLAQSLLRGDNSGHHNSLHQPEPFIHTLYDKNKWKTYRICISAQPGMQISNCGRGGHTRPFVLQPTAQTRGMPCHANTHNHTNQTIVCQPNQGG